MHTAYTSGMPTIQVRDLPEHIYRRLVSDAKRERRSISQQIVVTLASGLDVEVDPRERRRALIEKAKRLGKLEGNFPTPEQMIREDRDR